MRPVSDLPPSRPAPSIDNAPSRTLERHRVPRFNAPDLAQALNVARLPATSAHARAVATNAGQRAASPTGPIATQHLQRLDRSAYVQEIRDGIVATVIANIDHFRAHPPELAWAIMHLEYVTAIGVRECDAQLKYTHDVVSAAAQTLSAEDERLLRDAVHVAHYDRGAFEDLGRLPKELNAAAPHKTFADIVRIKQDASNPYASLYKTERAVASAFLATHGTGGWTEDGYLARAEPGIKGTFAGYTHVEAGVPSAIKDKIVSYRADPMLADHVVPFTKGIYAAWKSNFVEQAVFEATPSLTKRAGAGVVEELRCTSYIHELIEQARDWTPEQWTAARTSNDWHYGHATFDVSQVTLDHRTDPRDITQNDAVSRFAEPGDSPRHKLWNAWVYAFVDESSPEVGSAKTTVLRSRFGEAVDAATLAAAKAVLDAHQPNKVHAADLKAAYLDPNHPKAALFNRASGANVTGWDAIASIVERDRQAAAILPEERGVSIMSGSPMMAMPANAHPSFVAAAIDLARAALEHPYDASSRANAEAFLAIHG